MVGWGWSGGGSPGGVSAGCSSLPWKKENGRCRVRRNGGGLAGVCAGTSKSPLIFRSGGPLALVVDPLQGEALVGGCVFSVSFLRVMARFALGCVEGSLVRIFCRKTNRWRGPPSRCEVLVFLSFCRGGWPCCCLGAMAVVVVCGEKFGFS